MYVKRKDFINCIKCNDDFTKSSHLAKGFCRKCYGKNYYNKNKNIKDYFTRRKEKKDKHLVSLREKNKQKLYDFIDYTYRNRFLIDYVNALRLADLYEIYYTGPTTIIDGLKVEDQLIYMWNFISKLKKQDYV
jgi:hypothetical protein